MTEPPLNFRYLMNQLANRLIDFLKNELTIETTSITYVLNNIQKMELNYLTSLISLEGNVKLFVVLSYDTKFFDEIFSRYTVGLPIEDDEKEEAVIDSAGDIINIIVGNTLAYINESEQKITMSPPLVITGAKQIACQRDSLFYRANLITEFGNLDIYLVSNTLELNGLAGEVYE